MSDNPKKKVIPIPPPAPVYIKLKVLADLQSGNAFYKQGDTIEVFHHEAVKLLQEYSSYFDVLTDGGTE